MTEHSTWRRSAARQHARGKPTVFTIPAETAFVDALAKGILADADADPLALAAVTVLLPTRRACRSLREAFLRLGEGKPLLLPRLVPLNDIDDQEALFASYGAAADAIDIPPPISSLKRQMMLARLIGPTQPDLPVARALRLAQELANLLDQVQTERLTFDNLTNLVPEEYAAHWQETLRFMQVVTAAWPRILAGEDALDPAAHRNRVFAAQAAAWKAVGAGGPVIAAGSTGSIPATADLLATVAGLADGCVVLPGLDTDLSDEDWTMVDETHPQYGLKQLLGHLEIARAAVTLWPQEASSPGSRARVQFLSEVMRPAATTHAWQALTPLDPQVIEGVTRLDCAGPREESEAIALVMREALERRPGHNDRTCALVTPDRDLAERVAAELKRWNIDVDDSAGRPLSQTPPGAFLRLTAAMVAEDFAPVATLAVCKHPLAAGGRDPARFRALTRLVEREVLRGPRPLAGLEDLGRLARPEYSRDVSAWVAILKSCCGAFATAMRQDSLKQGVVPVSTLLNAHMEAAEALATTPDTAGPLRLWAEDAGEATAAFIAELAQCADSLPPISPRAYPAILEALMEDRVARPRYSKHPRLHILGPLEARLQHFDVLILGGLNEGTWPAAAPADPWMSRPMRKAFGLQMQERRIGQAAHDITQALCAPRVVLTRARKVEGTPTVPSRWLMRLERVIEATGLSQAFRGQAGDWLSWGRELTQPRAFEAGQPPAPRPPRAARPRKLSVTQIEAWMRDPYSVYARHILKLKALDPLEQSAGAADYGTLIHKALEKFVKAHPSGPLPGNALELLSTIGRAEFDAHALRPGVLAFWWPRFERIAAWFIDTEGLRRAALAQSFAEVTGKMILPAPGGSFELVATADRIDRGKDGRFTIIDYKTGTAARDSEVIAGFAPQLPLEAAILADGGFVGIPAGAVEVLSFWHLHGRGDGGDTKPIKLDAAKLAEAALKGLTELIAKFDDPATPYEARPNPDHAPKYSDFAHLARVKEWSADDGDA